MENRMNYITELMRYIIDGMTDAEFSLFLSLLSSFVQAGESERQALPLKDR